jgi:hypothetical protein
VAFDLKQIRKSEGIKAPRLLLYSTHGLGKTTFAASAPNVVFILTEDGLGRLEVDHFPIATSFASVIEALDSLAQQDHAFQTVAIDSLDWLDNLIWQDIHANNDAKDLAYGKGAVIAADYWRSVLDRLNDLRNDKGMTIILIAHCQIKRFDSPETEPYDRYMPKLQERSSALVQEWCDCVFFANYRTIVKSEDVGFNNKVSRGITTGERLIYTSEKPSHLAKNRFNLPETIPLSWDAFVDALYPQPKAA